MEEFDYSSISRLSLHELSERFPGQWVKAREEVIPLLKARDLSRIQAFEASAQSSLYAWLQRLEKSKKNPKVLASAIEPIVECRMKSLAIHKFYETSVRKPIEGDKQLSFRNRLISNHLFFRQGLERKPASSLTFKMLWPLMTQKERFLSLVNSAGIYCFYSKELIRSLAEMIGGRSCLEIAAGDGSLTQFLKAKAVNVRATDDYSWSHRIDFPAEVEKLSAEESLKKYQPQVVLCSWPPAQNDFEKHIFSTKSVEHYILISSRHRFAAGNWMSYESQNSFQFSLDENLSRMLLPPELESCVYIFRRTQNFV